LHERAEGEIEKRHEGWTTGVVAKRLGRSFIGIERDASFVRAARARIAGVEPLPHAAIAAVADKRSETRLPFAAIVEAGLVRPGEILADERKRHAAMVRADGTISIGPVAGSIHNFGALAQGLPACNGWTFWHFFREGKNESIDALRSLLRASLRPAAE
jgi:modification methylase